MDTDDPEHIGWLYTVASARAKEFNIEGVTWSLTQGVVKNIIPAIASTNAIVAGQSIKSRVPVIPNLPAMFSLMLQRSSQDRYDSRTISRQLFHAHRH